MSLTIAATATDINAPLFLLQTAAATLPATQRLTNEHHAEVLLFLAARPVHTVILAGFVRDNGLESPLNRGTFYACRNASGKLEGVALIGHGTFIETRTARAMEAFARLAQRHTEAHMILGEQERVEEFWSHYAKNGQAPRLACRELLFEQQRTASVAYRKVEGLRHATLEDLELVMPVHAALAYAESGVDPLKADPEGFRRRCARRIEKKRTWVLIENGELIFKADVQSDTPDVIYLEGIYVAPARRGKGYGLRCMSHLSENLLRRTKSLCLLVNEQNTEAHALYKRAGYKHQSCYDTIFLQPAKDN